MPARSPRAGGRKGGSQREDAPCEPRSRDAGAARRPPLGKAPVVRFGPRVGGPRARRARCPRRGPRHSSRRGPRHSSLAPAGENRARKRSSCLRWMEWTGKPRSIGPSTTGPCGSSMATSTASGTEPAEREERHRRGLQASPSQMRPRQPDTAFSPSNAGSFEIRRHDSSMAVAAIIRSKGSLCDHSSDPAAIAMRAV